MQTIKDIPIFPFGTSPNGSYISKEAVEKALDSFINIPIFSYDESDKYNIFNSPIGIITKITRIEEPFVYGDVVLFKDLETMNKFKNYEIQMDNYHKENEIYYIDEFKLQSVSFSMKATEEEDAE